VLCLIIIYKKQINKKNYVTEIYFSIFYQQFTDTESFKKKHGFYFMNFKFTAYKRIKLAVRKIPAQLIAISNINMGANNNPKLDKA
jgi:hypothetical protein